MRKYKPVSVKTETKEAIDRLSTVTGKSRTQIFSEIFEAIDGILASMIPCEKCKYIQMRVTDSIMSNRITISFIGKNTILLQHFQAPTETPDSEIDKTIKERVEESFTKQREVNKNE